VTTLDTLDYLILLELLNNPTITVTELALKLNSSRPTVTKYLKKLKEKGIIRNTIANIYPERLNLIIVDVLAFVSSYENLLLLEKACDEHPYTYYRSRIYGGKFGLFMIFYTPIGSISNIDEFFKKLLKNNIINDYQVYESNGISYSSSSDISRFNIEKSKWDFSWEKWISTIEQEKDKMLVENIDPIDLKVIKRTHFEILRMLTENAAIKQKEISKKLNLSKTEAHRQYNFVLEKFIKEIRQTFNRNNFLLTETFLIIAHNVPEKKLAKINNKMRNDPPPFYGSLLILKDNKFRFWVNMSIDQAGTFIFSLFEYFNDIEVYTLNTRKGGSVQYHFYPENFDFDSKNWKDSKNYMIKKPLERLNLKI